MSETILMGGLMLLLAVIGYFLKEFGEQVKQLKLIVQELQIAMVGEKSRSESYWKACEVAHQLIDKKFDGVEVKLEKHGNKIAEHDLAIKLWAANNE